jgi:plastocyanin
MHPTGVASAAWVFAAAPSKVPFYIAGGLLAAWALLLSAFGITHPEFPGSEGRGRFVMLTSALLVVAAMTAGALTAGEEAGTAEGEAAPAPRSPAAAAIDLSADASGAPAFDKKDVVVRAGRVAMRFTNPSPVPHNVTIAKGAKVVGQTKTIEDATATADAALTTGEYVFYCSVDGHRQAGMQGKLTVR